MSARDSIKLEDVEAYEAQAPSKDSRDSIKLEDVEAYERGDEPASAIQPAIRHAPVTGLRRPTTAASPPPAAPEAPAQAIMAPPPSLAPVGPALQRQRDDKRNGILQQELKDAPNETERRYIERELGSTPYDEQIRAQSAIPPTRTPAIPMPAAPVTPHVLESSLTPQERNIVGYHRDTVKEGKTGRDEEGRPVTVYSTGIEVREGPFKGQFVSVPGFVDGKIERDENKLYERWKGEIDAGKWPLYASGEALNQRSQQIHGIMDAEGDAIPQGPAIKAPGHYLRRPSDLIAPTVEIEGKRTPPRGTPMYREWLASLSPDERAEVEAIDKEEGEPDSSFESGWKTGVTGIKQMGTAAALIPTFSAITSQNTLMAQYEAIDKGQPVDDAAMGMEERMRLAEYRDATPESRAAKKQAIISDVLNNREAMGTLLSAWKEYQTEIQSYQGRVVNASDINDLEDFGSWFAFSTGQALPYFVLLAMGGIPAGIVGGAGAGVVSAGAVSYGLAVGDIKGGLLEKGLGPEADMTALLYAIPYAAMEALGPTGRVAMRFLRPTIIRQAYQGWLVRTGKEAFISGTGEHFNEFLQEFVKDAGVASETGEELFTEQNLLQWANAGAAGTPSGAIAGAALGAASPTGEPPAPIDRTGDPPVSALPTVGGPPGPSLLTSATPVEPPGQVDPTLGGVPPPGPAAGPMPGATEPRLNAIPPQPPGAEPAMGQAIPLPEQSLLRRVEPSIRTTGPVSGPTEPQLRTVPVEALGGQPEPPIGAPPELGPLRAPIDHGIEPPPAEPATVATETPIPAESAQIPAETPPISPETPTAPATKVTTEEEVAPTHLLPDGRQVNVYLDDDGTPVEGLYYDEDGKLFETTDAKPLPELDDPVIAPVVDRATKVDSYRQDLEAMARNAGWAEMGGRMTRTPTGEAAGDEIIGRTKWIPKEAWWTERPVRINEAQTKDAVRKALAGEKLTKTEQKMIDFMLEVIEREETASKADFTDVGVQDSPENREATDLFLRASLLDDEGFAALTTQFPEDADTPALIAATKELIRAKEKEREDAERQADTGTGVETAGVGGPQTPSTEAPARQDQTGADTAPAAGTEAKVPVRQDGGAEVIKAELEALEPARKALKERAMIYQADRKEEIARAKGLPPDTYFDMPYAEWGKIDKEFSKEEAIAGVHAKADELGIPWDNDEKFMEFTQRVTGHRHLDDLTPKQLSNVIDGMTSTRFAASNDGMAPGKWKVVDTVTNQTARTADTKSGAQSIADGLNKNGPEGISGSTKEKPSGKNQGKKTAEPKPAGGPVVPEAPAIPAAKADEKGGGTRKVKLGDGREIEVKGSGATTYWRDPSFTTGPYGDRFVLASPSFRADIEAGESGVAGPVAQTPDQIYDASLETFRAASRAFRTVTQEYRAKKIGDTEFLSAKATFEQAKAAADAAETAFIEAKNGGILEARGTPPSFDLTPATEAELKASADAVKAADKTKDLAIKRDARIAAKVELDAREAKIRKERADAAVADFELGQAPPSKEVSKDEAAGQAGLFGDDVIEARVAGQAIEVAAAPTEAQKEAGNYLKGKFARNGMNFRVETVKGQKRFWTEPGGTVKSKVLKYAYGYVSGTETTDGEEVDAIFGDGDIDQAVYAIDQNKADGSFDEPKLMFGFSSEDAAKAGYLANYETGWTGFGDIRPLSWAQLKQWLAEGDLTKRAADWENATDTSDADRRHDQRAARYLRVWAIIDKTVRNLNAIPYVNVANTAAGLPSHIKINKGTYALYDRRTGQVWLIADRMTDAEVLPALLHELTAHRGLRALINSAELDALMDEIYEARKADIQRESDRGFLSAYEFDFRNIEHRRRAAEEFIAHEAEQGREQTLWGRVIALVRRLLEAIAGPTREWTDNDIVDLLRLSRQALRNNGPVSTQNGAPAEQRVYHGTPNTWESGRPELKYIGTGEGNQAYGWGLYFASERATAEYYRRRLAGDPRYGNILMDGVPLETMSRPGANLVESTLTSREIELAWQHLEYYVRLYRDAQQGLEEAKRVANLLAGSSEEDALRRGEFKELHVMKAAKRLFEHHNITVTPHVSPGKTYETEIPEDVAMLDWDNPVRFSDLAKLQPAFRDSLTSFLQDNRDLEIDDLTGREFYQLLRNDAFRRDAVSGSIAMSPEEQASRYLASIGIPGIKYVGATSGEINYVIFDEGAIGDVNILEARRAQTESPEFKRWFGDSKVVDENGAPIVAFHGTKADFAAFDTQRARDSSSGKAWLGDLGTWFAAPSLNQSNYDEGNAEFVAETFIETRALNAYKEGANVRPVYLAIKNPAEFEGYEDVLDNAGGWEPDGTKLKEKLIARGHDGVVVRNSMTDGFVDRDDWVAFRPEQIKSAIGNRGTFDPVNPDILEARRQTPHTTRVYGVRDNAVKGAAVKRGDAWDVYIAAPGAAPTRLQASSLREVTQIFNRYSLDTRIFREPWMEIERLRLFEPFQLAQPCWLATKGNEFVRRVVDDAHAVKGVQFDIARHKAAYDRYGKTWSQLTTDERKILGDPSLPDDIDAYLARELWSSIATAQLRDAEAELINPLIAHMTDNGISLDEADIWRYASHAKERNDRLVEIDPDNDAGSGMTTADANLILDAPMPERRRALDRLIELADKLEDYRLKVLEEGGIISTEDRLRMKAAYTHYAPLRDPLGDVDPAELGINDKPQLGGRPRRAFGRTTKAGDIMAYSVAQMQLAVILAEQNKVRQVFLKLVQANPHEELWQIDKIDWRPMIDRATGEKVLFPDRAQGLRSNEIPVFVGGKKHVITVLRPDVAAAMKKFGYAMPGIVQLFRHLTTYVTMINTALDPTFTGLNFQRDLLTSGIYLSTEQSPLFAGKVMKDVPAAMWAALKGLRRDKAPANPTAWDQHYLDWTKAGGRIDFYGLRDLESVVSDIKSKMNDADPSVGRRAVMGLTATKKLVMDLNSAVEGATRLSVYKNLIAQGVSPARAASASLNVTVNFLKRGADVTWLRSMYAFAGATINSTARLTTWLVSKHGWKVGLAIAITGAMDDYWKRLIAGDDEDGKNYWDKVPAHRKQRNFILIEPDTGVTDDLFALPYGPNVLWTIGQNISAVMFGPKQTGEAAGDILAAILTATSPLGDMAGGLLQLATPSFFDPVTQHYENKNWFGGKVRPEQPRYTLPVPESELYFQNTPAQYIDAARYLNELGGGDAVMPGKIEWLGLAIRTDISPNVMQHYLRSYTGGAGQFLSRLAGLAIDKAKGEDTPAREIPIMRRFNIEPNESQTGQDFYTNITEVKLLDTQWRMYREMGDQVTASWLQRENSRPLRLLSRAKNVEEKVQDLKAKIREHKEAGRAGRAESDTAQMLRLQKQFNRDYYFATEPD